MDSDERIGNRNTGAGAALTIYQCTEEDFRGFDRALLKSKRRKIPSGLLSHRKNGRYFLKEELQRNIIWSQFCIVTDTSFNEFELITCRRTLHEFGSALKQRTLKQRTLRLFADSLRPFGIVDIELQDELANSDFDLTYEPLRTQPDLYRRRG